MLVEVWMTAVLSWGDYFGALVSFFFFFHLGIGWFCSREPIFGWVFPAVCLKSDKLSKEATICLNQLQKVILT